MHAQRSSVPVRLTTLLAAFALLAPPASADPRWWWSDQQLTRSATDSITPHACITGIEGGAQGGAVLVTWAEVDPVGGDLEIWLTASFDGACSFCEPTRITDNAVDDTNPRIAAVVKADATFTIQVVFEQQDNVIVAWDADTLSLFQPRAVACQQLQQLGADIIMNAQYEQLNMPGFDADQPDISAIVHWNGIAGFHAAFRQQGAVRDDIVYRHDLGVLGGAGWFTDPAKVLTAAHPGLLAREPAIAADLFTDPDPSGGGSTMSRMGVSVVFVDTDGISGGGQIFGLRSTDSGATFSADGTRLDGLPGVVSDPSPGRSVAEPAMASGANGFSFADPAWFAAAWEDGRAGNPAPEIALDGRFLTAPNVPLPDWQLPDAIVTSTADIKDGSPTLALQFSWGAPTSAWLGWEDRRSGAAEIHYRGGQLDATAMTPLDFAAFPFTPSRAADPTVSVDTQLTGCRVDDVTLACLPTRVSGSAHAPALVADFSDTHAVWSDTRDGAANIWFKKTDRWTWMPTARVAPVCSDLGVAALDVTFDRQRSCPLPNTNERMGRYLVYYGTDVGGPFLNAASPVVVEDDDAIGSLVTVRLDGLSPGQAYRVIVVPEDQARNVYPQDFDPTFDGPMALINEVGAIAPAPCAPDLVVRCVLVADRCAADPGLDRNGLFEPGELVDVRLTVINGGDAAALDWSGVLTATGATVVTPAGGLLALAEIPANDSATLFATLQLPRFPAASCGDPVDMTLVSQASNGSLSWPDQSLATCDGSLTIPCVECGLTPEVIVRSCGVVRDACAGGGPGDDDGDVDPGDEFDVQVVFENVGGAVASGFSARLAVVTGATVVGSDVLGAFTLAPGASMGATVTLTATAPCGGLIDLDVVALTSDGGTYSWPDVTACEQRVGTNHVARSITWRDDLGFGVPDGGAQLNYNGCNAVVSGAVERVSVAALGFFPAPANLAARLFGPSGAAVDVTAALGGSVDVTADYLGVLGGPGQYDLEVRELAPDANWPSVSSWTLTVESTTAACEPCGPPACLHRSDVTGLAPHVPARALVYGPETIDGVTLRGVAYACPFRPGDLEPDAVALTNGVTLSLYQVDRRTDTLRLRKAGGTIGFDF